MRAKRSALIAAASVLFFIAIWWALSESGLVSRLFLPTPGEVFESGLKMLSFGENSIWEDTLATLARSVLAFLLAAAAGIPLGLLMGAVKPVYDSLEFLVDSVRSIPPLALFPLFMLVFGIGDESKIALTAFAAGLIILVNSSYGVRHGSRLRLKLSTLMGAGRLKVFRSVMLPEALPHVMAGARTALSIVLIIIIITEMFAGTTSGLGRRILEEMLMYRTANMYVAIIMTGFLGYVMNKAFVVVENRALHWVGK